MKRLRFISYSIMSFTLMALQLSCSSDNNVGGDISGTPITFSISTTAENPNTAATRTATPPQEIILAPIKMTSNLDSAVYLHTIISNFPVAEQPSATTKGALTTSISSFGISAYKYSSGNASAATDKYIDNQQCNVTGTSASTSTTYYWPNNATDELAFYAYTPWSNSDVVVKSDRRQIKYSVNSTVTSQQDLLTASSLDNNIGTAASKTVALTFNHALTAINFVVGDDMIPGTIKSISFENIITSGTYTIGGGWSGNTTSTFTYSPKKAIAGTNGEAITSSSDNTTLLMIPQEFTADNQKIKIVFNDGSADHTLYAALKATKWEAGKQITYKISSSAVTTLNIGSITFPTAWNSYSFPKTAYANSDAAGIFIVDNNNKVKNANVKLTYDGTKWTPASSLIYSPQYKYFVYYPYRSTLTGAPAAGSSNNSTTAAAFFTSVISNWTISTTQTSSTLTSEDLQYAIGTTTSSNSSVSFSMTHGMGLAKIVLGSKSVPKVAVYLGSTLKYSTREKKTIYATDQFNGNTPYKTSNYNYIALVKPSTATTFKSQTNVVNSWDANISANVAANNVYTYTANSARTYYYKGYAYEYTGAAQSFTAPVAGNYKIQCWGASARGCGAYTCGTISLTANKVLYIYCGQVGLNGSSTPITTWRFNGGGGHLQVSGDKNNNTGAGATDIRTTKGNWNDFESLKTRIMVAAGAGGSITATYPGHGGTTTAPKAGICTNIADNHTIDGPTQISGYAFGYGQHGDNTSLTSDIGRAGGGGGYYGGYAQDIYGTGGSSFISGHSGCNAIASNSTSTNIIHTGKAGHYSGLVFTDTAMCGGGDSMPLPYQDDYGIGYNGGNGVCIITELVFH